MFYYQSLGKICRRLLLIVALLYIFSTYQQELVDNITECMHTWNGEITIQLDESSFKMAWSPSSIHLEITA